MPLAIATPTITTINPTVTLANGRLHFTLAGGEQISVDVDDFRQLASSGRGEPWHPVIVNAALFAAQVPSLDLTNGAAVALALTGQPFKTWG